MMMNEQSLLNRWAAHIGQWPRLLRILLTLMITVFLVLLVWMALAELVGGGLTNSKPNPILTLVVLALSIPVYGAGWAALVGFENRDTHEWHAGPSAVYFMLAGVLALVVMIIVFVLLVA